MNLGTALVLTVVIAVSCAALRSVIMKGGAKSCCKGCSGCKGCCSVQECCDLAVTDQAGGGKAASAKV